MISHLKFWGNKLEEVNLEIDENDKILDLVWHKLYKIDIDSFTSYEMPFQSQINVYTDGSKTDTHVGAGFVIIKNNRTVLAGNRRLPDKATVFEAEVMAIQVAMLGLSGYIKDNNRYVKSIF